MISGALRYIGWSTMQCGLFSWDEMVWDCSSTASKQQLIQSAAEELQAR